jgi:hypothetical protein
MPGGKGVSCGTSHVFNSPQNKLLNRFGVNQYRRNRDEQKDGGCDPGCTPSPLPAGDRTIESHSHGS